MLRKRIVVVLRFLCVFTGTLIVVNAWAASTGKIAGRVIDQSTGDALPGANLVIEGTAKGAATDLEGYYTILNVPPGTYNLTATMIGYAALKQETVQVNVNQTSTINFGLVQEAVAGEEVVISATRPAVQMDVSASQRIVTAESIVNRPVENLEEVLSLEVGVALSSSSDGNGLIVRGGQLNETDIVVDGMSTRNERNAQANTNLSLTAIQEIELLTGGFTAEYGDIRSGMVNVITKEGRLDRYSLTFDGRISPPARKHFGPSPYSIEGPFWQVYAGADAYTGVTQEMVDAGDYAFTFEGWNAWAAANISNLGYTPQQALEIWKWQHRKRDYADKPDYIGDVSVSGRVPLTSATFLLSQRYEDLQLVYPFSRNNSTASSTLLKLTQKLSSNLKLTFNNNYIIANGVSGSIYDDTIGMITGSREGTIFARDEFTERQFIWNDANFNPIETKQYRGGLFLNHLLSSKTFYDLRVEYTSYRARQEPIRVRDTTPIITIGNVNLDEQPNGYVSSALGGGITEKYDILGKDLMSGGGRGQDHSKYWGFQVSGDLVSQMNKHNEVKLGFNFEYTDFSERREINHSETTSALEDRPWYWWYYDAQPVKMAGYIQDKLEFEGLIANVGMRLDYYNTGTDASNLDPEFIFSNNPYTLATYREGDNSWSQLSTSDKGAKLYLSPRLGISHPVTASSKIYFNYGHTLQPNIGDQLFLNQVDGSGRGGFVPNVNANWPRTVNYEVGFEKGIGDTYLIHLSGYYKDVSDQLEEVRIISLDQENDVSTLENTSYADIRGVELRLEKRLGRWWFGTVSLEYLTQSEGLTGFEFRYEDRQLANQQRNQARQTKSTGVPQVIANLNFTTPIDFGPMLLGGHVLGNWRLNWLQLWSDGGQELINEDAPLQEQIFIDRIDYANTDILLEKRFNLKQSNSIGVFMHVRNLFNNRGPVNPRLPNQYRDSLHLPHEQGAQKGNDKLGEWDKDYIDIGWNTWSHFINPRDIYFGLRLNF